MRKAVKRLTGYLFLILAFPFAAVAVFGRFKPGYTFCAQLVSLGPGLPGDYLRRGFYRLTLKRFSFESRIGFGSIFSHPQAEVADLAGIGERCILGMVTIGERANIASGAQVLSGFRQHSRDQAGKLGEGSFEMVAIGADAWIGAGALIMASIGERTNVAAGSVVFLQVASDVSVAGNPARVVSKRATDS
jgi:acetyltransferase-like isoleucine patch superfamily enzyme